MTDSSSDLVQSSSLPPGVTQRKLVCNSDALQACLQNNNGDRSKCTKEWDDFRNACQRPENNKDKDTADNIITLSKRRADYSGDTDTHSAGLARDAIGPCRCWQPAFEAEILGNRPL
ncbi:hypothetical protein BASA62_002199 [Batrachochytrium salamandrivorans]|nr:hypothetical protein BASA62_002199 [Batrachochytrium salamandrivorans]